MWKRIGVHQRLHSIQRNTYHRDFLQVRWGTIDNLQNQNLTAYYALGWEFEYQVLTSNSHPRTTLCSQYPMVINHLSMPFSHNTTKNVEYFSGKQFSQGQNVPKEENLLENTTRRLKLNACTSTTLIQADVICISFQPFVEPILKKEYYLRPLEPNGVLNKTNYTFCFAQSGTTHLVTSRVSRQLIKIDLCDKGNSFFFASLSQQ